MTRHMTMFFPSLENSYVPDLNFGIGEIHSKGFSIQNLNFWSSVITSLPFYIMGSYAAMEGTRGFNKEASKYFQDKASIEFDPVYEVLATMGATQGLNAAANSMEGKLIGYFYPGYPAGSYLRSIKANLFPMEATSPDELVDKLDENASDLEAVIINSPNNPWGYSLNSSHFEAIGEIAEKNNIMLIMDVVYQTLTQKIKTLDYSSLPPDKTVFIESFSKGMASACLRLGMAYSKNKEFLTRMKEFVADTTVGVGTLSLSLGESMLKKGISSHTLLSERYDAFHEEIEIHNFESIGITPQHQNEDHNMMYRLLDVSKLCDKKGTTPVDIKNQFIEQGILVIPIQAFYPSEIKAPDVIRLSLGKVSVKEMPVAVDKLFNAFNSLP